MIATIRDVSIILLALESIVVLILLSILIVQVRNLVVVLNEEIKPMLQATQETADTVRNTTNFVSNRVARPAINALSFGAGVRQAAKTLRSRTIPGENGDTAQTPPDKPSSPPAAPSSPLPSEGNGSEEGVV